LADVAFRQPEMLYGTAMRIGKPLVAFAVSLLLTGACGDDDDSDGDAGRPDADPNAPDAAPDGPDAGNPPPACDPVEGVPALTLERVTDGLTAPTTAVVPPGDDRIFVTEQPGLISIFDGNTVLEEPFLDILGIVDDSQSERGLLGLAFHPDYPTDNRFFVYYTSNDENLILAEYKALTLDDADEESEVILLSIPHPDVNHNGGWLAFGPDGYLYMATGDGGGGGDPGENGQDRGELLGKMLRLDVNTPGEYSSPATNPFVGTEGLDEIWAYGLRNPWRNSFDRQTGDLYIADVGQNAMEEINVQPADDEGGLNYGWDEMEGTLCFEPSSNCNMTGKVLPVYTYRHDELPGDRASVTGGVVYRGCRMPDLHGTYFFGEAVHGFVRSFKWNGGGGVTDEKAYPQFDSELGSVYAFGEDAEGEILVLDGGGEIFRIVPAAP
jgi:glucose/arabinose dehydrogenase